MRYGINLINNLLDSYEDSGNFDGNIGRRVYLKKSFKRPSGDSAEYEEFLSELLELRKKRIVDFDWQIKEYVAGRIWLVLENVQSAYDNVGRENKHAALERVRKAVLKSKSRIGEGWIKAYLDRVLDDISNNKLSGFWNSDMQLIDDVFKALKDAVK